MDRQHIDKTLSPYAKFMVENQGFDFYDKKTNLKMDRWEVFAHIEQNPNEQESIVNGNSRKFIKKPRPKDIKSF